MRTPKKFLVGALAGVAAIGSFGAAAAIGENALGDEPRPQVALSAEHSEARTDDLADLADRSVAIEYAGALHDDRLEDYALIVFYQEVERAEAAAAAAAAAAAQAASYGAGGAGGSLASIRACESGGNYGAVSPNGQYRGAYQFDYQTWASVGGSLGAGVGLVVQDAPG
ncbi:MAG: transglycosylase family protein [Actinomycetota bacterium]